MQVIKVLNPASDAVSFGLRPALWPDPTLRSDQCRILENPSEIPVMRMEDGSASRLPAGSPQLLSVVFSGDQVELELAHPTLRTISVEYTNNPLTDTWKPLGTIEAGETVALFSASVLAENALLRLTWRDGDSTDTTGPAVPASVLERLRRRPARGRNGVLRVQSRGDLLGQDLSYLDAFAEQLSQIQEDVDRLKKGARREDPDSAGGGGSDKTSYLVEDTTKPWLWEMEQVAMTIHGPVISGFAIGLPAPVTSTGWESFDGSDDGDLDADSAEAISNPAVTMLDDNPTMEALSHRTDPERLKKVRRERIAAYAGMEARLSVVSYMGLARLTLCFYCAGNWQEDDPAGRGAANHPSNLPLGECTPH